MPLFGHALIHKFIDQQFIINKKSNCEWIGFGGKYTNAHSPMKVHLCQKFNDTWKVTRNCQNERILELTYLLICEEIRKYYIEDTDIIIDSQQSCSSAKAIVSRDKKRKITDDNDEMQDIVQAEVESVPKPAEEIFSPFVIELGGTDLEIRLIIYTQKKA